MSWCAIMGVIWSSLFAPLLTVARPSMNCSLRSRSDAVVDATIGSSLACISLMLSVRNSPTVTEYSGSRRERAD
ncbi:hypothetical protein V1506DRAFT_535105 [Lipomyces tetrasporus]